MLDNLVTADNLSLVDESADAEDSRRVFYGSDSRIFTNEELEQW